MERKLLLMAALVAVVLPAGCVSQEAKLQERYAEGLRPYNIVGLEKAGLTAVWEQNLNLDSYKDETALMNVWLYPATIIAAGDDGFLYAFDRLTGTPEWLVKLPVPFAHRPDLQDGVYYGISGSRLAMVDRAGMLNVNGKLPVSITAPIVSTGEYLYAASGAGNIYKLDLTKLREVWPSPTRTAGAIVHKPVVIGPYLVIGNTAGEVEAIDMVTSGRQARFKARAGISGVVVDSDYIYAGSVDFYVYCITVNGTLKWKTLVRAPVQDTPMLSRDVLYVTTMGKGLQALNKENGDIIWQTAGVTKLLSAGGGLLFAKSGDDELWVLDAKSGQTRDRVHIGQFDMTPQNDFNDGLVYLVTADGRLVCLRAL